MNPPTLRPHETERLQRLEGHADALLGRVIALHIQLGFADPLMPPDAPLLPPPDHRRFYGGLSALRETLVRGCVLDFVGAVSDEDRRTPSLVSLAKELEKDEVVTVLRRMVEVDAYRGVGGFQVNDSGFGESERRQAVERFEEQLDQFRTAWTDFEARPFAQELKAVRDKVVAHKELRSTPDGYQFVSPSGLNIPWSEFLDECLRLGKLCELVGLIVRRTHFVFSHEVEGLLEAGRHLWMDLGVITDPSQGERAPDK